MACFSPCHFTSVSRFILQDLSRLAELAGVKAIRPVIVVPAPKTFKSKVVKDKSDPAVPKDVFSTHVMTGVDKVQAAGNIGKGVKIGMCVPSLLS